MGAVGHRDPGGPRCTEYGLGKAGWTVKASVLPPLPEAGMKIGIADTTFARVNMGKIAIDEINKHASIATERYTVPGIKDLRWPARS